jgi:hypothetical protein
MLFSGHFVMQSRLLSDVVSSGLATIRPEQIYGTGKKQRLSFDSVAVVKEKSDHSNSC